jgi:hypothetical protein
MDELERRRAHVDAQHWEQPWETIRNAQEIPRRDLQIDCYVRVQAYIMWSESPTEWVDTIAFAWAADPRVVHVELSDPRYQFRGLWLWPWDVRPVDDIGSVRKTRPPWSGDL